MLPFVRLPGPAQAARLASAAIVVGLAAGAAPLQAADDDNRRAAGVPAPTVVVSPIPAPGSAAGPGRPGDTAPVPGSVAASTAAAPLATPPTAPPAGTVMLYRSTMPNGRIVIGDRPEPGARRTVVIGAAPAGDRSGTARAQQEREYWRQRADAFAQRQRQRQSELDAERERDARLAERERAAEQARVLAGPLILFRPREQLNYTGQQPPLEYGSTPGAAGRNLGAPGMGGLAGDAVGIGASSGTPGVGALGAPGVGFGVGSGNPAGTGAGGFGPGAAGGAPAGFIGSGFSTSGR